MNKHEGFGILYFQDRTKIAGTFKNDISINNLQTKIVTINENNLKNDAKKKLGLKSLKSLRRGSTKSNVSSDTSRLKKEKILILKILKILKMMK